MTVVLNELLEYVVLAVLKIYLFYDNWIARFKVEQVVVRLVKVMLHFLFNDIDMLLIKRLNVFKKLESTLTTDNVVLEDVVDAPHLPKNDFFHEF